MSVMCWHIYENQDESSPPFVNEQKPNGALNSPRHSKTKCRHFANIVQATQGQCLFPQDSIFSVISKISRLNTRNSTKGCFFKWLKTYVGLHHFAIKDSEASLSKNMLFHISL